MTQPLNDDLDLLAQLLAEAGVAQPGAEGVALVRREFAGPAPASYAQELVWLFDQGAPGSTAYNVPIASRLSGALDVAALARSLDALVARHEAFRTVFSQGEHGALQDVRAAGPVEVLQHDLRHLDRGAREAEATRLLRERAATPFDLTRDLLLRAMLLRVEEREYRLLLETHHIVFDGWSLGIVLRELSALYDGFRSGTPVMLPEPRLRPRDHAAWEREQLSGPRLERLLEYWRSRLAGAPASLELPTDTPRPVRPTFEGGEAVRMVPRPVLDELKALAQKNGATLYMVLMAAYQAVLHRWTGQDEILTGSAIAGRTQPELEGVVGYLANTLVLRSSFGDDPPFGTLLERMRDTCLGAFDHQEIPLEKLILELRRDAIGSATPLFQAVLTMQDPGTTRLSLGEVILSALAVDVESTKFDLTLFPTERPEGLRLMLHFRSDLFQQATAERFLGHLETLLRAAAAAPSTRVSALELLTAAEREQLRAWSEAPAPSGAPISMAALIAAAAARHPERVAVVSGDSSLTWKTLTSRAARLAGDLRARGVGPDVPVGLCLDRSVDLIVGMVGILWSGGAYIPLLPDQPAARLQQQLDASGARLVITATPHLSRFPSGIETVFLDAEATGPGTVPVPPPATGASSENLAYVLFTSGSTGVPKGVAVSHGNLVHYTRGIAARLGIDLEGSDEAWHCGTVSTLAADLGHTAVFTALASGGTLHVLPAEVVLDAARYREYLSRHPLDLLKITPSHLQALAGPELAPEHLPRRWLVLGGEACPWALTEAVLARGTCRVLNHYGPTETTVGATTFEVHTGTARGGAATVPIGRPLPGVTAAVLDARLHPLPVGIPGELWLGGGGVARGYLGRDDLTAERFGDSGGARRYRTGDRVRRHPSGDLEFLGRLDLQVKVRGHRVELGEIDASLAAHPSVRQAAVVLRDDALVAYVVPGSPVADEVLAAHLAARLPAYMVPTTWIHLEQLPLNANGKVDRAALPAPTAPVSASAPQSETERRLAAIWAEVLKRDAVGREENFFAIGGHSLLAIRLLGKVAKVFGVRLPLRALFEHPTIAQLAGVLSPEHPIEQALAPIWAEVLKRPSVGRDDNFFALGGHSLLAIRLLGKVAKAFGVRLPLRALFEAPTIAQLAPLIAAAASPAVSADATPTAAAPIRRRTREPEADSPGPGTGS